MSLLSLIFGNRNASASVAKERLQLIIARERVNDQAPDFLPSLQRELIEVISKYVNINPNDIKVGLERQGKYEVLEVNIVLPELAAAAAAATAPAAVAAPATAEAATAK